MKKIHGAGLIILSIDCIKSLNILKLNSYPSARSKNDSRMALCHLPFFTKPVFMDGLGINFQTHWPSAHFDWSKMNTPIPDEVMREMEEQGTEYASSKEANKHTQCPACGTEFWPTALEAYSIGAQAFYLKGREDMAREIAEWLRSELPLPMKLYEAQFWADKIESKFLPKSEDKE